jgi:hypothetical protein
MLWVNGRRDRFDSYPTRGEVAIVVALCPVCPGERTCSNEQRRADEEQTQPMTSATILPAFMAILLRRTIRRVRSWWRGRSLLSRAQGRRSTEPGEIGDLPGRNKDGHRTASLQLTGRGPATLASDLGRAKLAEDAGFMKLSVMDHVWQISMVGPEENAMLEAYTALATSPQDRANRVAAWDGGDLSAARAPGQSGDDARRAVAGTGLAGYRSSVERGRERRARAAVPVTASASSAWKKRRRSACRCGATARHRTWESTTHWDAP